MAWSTHRWRIILVLAFFVTAITAAGVFAGWVMDHSLLSFSGGGRPCYVDSVIAVWCMVLVVGIPIWVPVGSAHFARWLTDKICG